MNNIISAVERGEHLNNNNLECNPEDGQDSLITSTTAPSSSSSHKTNQSDASIDSGIPVSAESGNEVNTNLLAWAFFVS